MENEKKKYLKPLLKVAEWDFNEAVCQDFVSHTSKTICIDVPQGQFDPHYTEIITDETRWEDWRQTN